MFPIVVIGSSSSRHAERRPMWWRGAGATCNILFFTEEARPRLAPAFDQVSMLYAPTPDGQLPARAFTIPTVTSHTLDVWDDAREAAQQFWRRGREDARLSDDVRTICAENGRLLETKPGN